MKKIIIKGEDIARILLWKEIGEPKDDEEITLYQLEENESFPLAKIRDLAFSYIECEEDIQCDRCEKFREIYKALSNFSD